MPRPCVFFDRDGVVNTAPNDEEYYVLSPDRLFIEPGWIDALRIVNQKGYAAVIVTNQKCVHKGLITATELDQIHLGIWNCVAEHQLKLDAIYSAIAGDDDGNAKPSPGMLYAAAADHALDLAASIMVGDSERDIAAGVAAGCKHTVFVGEGKTAASHQVSGVDELARLLENLLEI